MNPELRVTAFYTPPERTMMACPSSFAGTDPHQDQAPASATISYLRLDRSEPVHDPHRFIGRVLFDIGKSRGRFSFERCEPLLRLA